MPRPTKKSEALRVPLETAHIHLANLVTYNKPVSRMRIQQAIERHPDLKALLEPLLAEMDSQFADVKKVKALVKQAKEQLE